MLAALELVDYVVVFDDARAEKIIRTVRPDILIKGEDYAGQVVDGQRFVESYGGRVTLAPILEGHSTTAKIAQVRDDGKASASNRPASNQKRRAKSKV